VGPHVACTHGKCALCWSLCRIHSSPDRSQVRASLKLCRIRNTTLNRFEVLVRVGLGNSRLVCVYPCVYIHVEAEKACNTASCNQEKTMAINFVSIYVRLASCD
jgi:hypothetical protein